MADKEKTLPDPVPDPVPHAVADAGVAPSLPATSGQLTVPTKPPSPPTAAAASGSWSWWIWAGLVAAVLLAAALWYFQPWITKGVPVTLETVATAPLTRVLAVNGRIAPLHLVQVTPLITGKLTAVLGEEGSGMMQGDTLAQIDAMGQQATVRQALAGLDAGLVGETQAKTAFARATALGGTISRLALDDARSAQQTATQDVVRLQAAFDQSQIDLAKFTLLAPITGTILTRTAEVGQVVDPATPMFSMANLGQLVVETDVDEGYAAQITTGLRAVLQMKGATAPQGGKVSFVAAQVDAATGGLAVKISFDAPVAAPVGLTVTANIVVDHKDVAIAVPRAAVVRDAAGDAVFVAKAGKAVRTAVTVVDWPADRIEVTSGLMAGDQVITDATGLLDGAAITIPAVAVPAP